MTVADLQRLINECPPTRTRSIEAWLAIARRPGRLNGSASYRDARLLAAVLDTVATIEHQASSGITGTLLSSAYDVIWGCSEIRLRPPHGTPPPVIDDYDDDDHDDDDYDPDPDDD